MKKAQKSAEITGQFRIVPFSVHAACGYRVSVFVGQG
jgi:hypothetical protein